MVKSNKEKTDYKNQYNKNNYARIGIYVKPEVKAEIEKHIATTGESVNGFINRAISETMQRDKGE